MVWPRATCWELSVLPKASRYQAAAFRKQTPGSVSNLLAPGGVVSFNVLDRSHPGTRTPRKNFPSVSNDAFIMRAFPHSLLAPPDNPITSPPTLVPFESFSQRIERLTAQYPSPWQRSLLFPQNSTNFDFLPLALTTHKHDQVPFSLEMIMQIKRLSKKKVVRNTISKKIKQALGLIVARGATVRDQDYKPVKFNHKTTKSEDLFTEFTYMWHVELEEKDMGDPLNKWVLPGWTYTCCPNLEVYRMPMQVLIPVLRDALATIFQNGARMEKEWVMHAEPSRHGSPHSPAPSPRHLGTSTHASPFRYPRSPRPSHPHSHHTAPSRTSEYPRRTPSDSSVPSGNRRSLTTSSVLFHKRRSDMSPPTPPRERQPPPHAPRASEQLKRQVANSDAQAKPGFSATMKARQERMKREQEELLKLDGDWQKELDGIQIAGGWNFENGITAPFDRSTLTKDTSNGRPQKGTKSKRKHVESDLDSLLSAQFPFDSPSASSTSNDDAGVLEHVTGKENLSSILSRSQPPQKQKEGSDKNVKDILSVLENELHSLKRSKANVARGGR